jgi:phosphoribosylaminoimidazole (AIR) synthetase
MFEVFNMGIGMVLVVARHHAEEVAAKTGSKVVGQVTPGSGRVLLT